MAGDRQHHLPAALIGGFGHATGPNLRDADVQWRRRDWTTPRPTKAAKIGYVNALYRLTNPPPGTDPDYIDGLWDLVEPPLPDAIRRLERRKQTTADELALVNYVAAAGVRHPEFEDAVNRWLTEQGKRTVSGDSLQITRMESFTQGLPVVRGYRWRVLHSPTHAHRFIINDRGWIYFGQEGRDGRGLFVPLNGRVALLGWLNRTSAGGFDHRDLRPTWVKWFNAGTWSDAPQFVVGHPHDIPMLTRLRTPNEIRSELNGGGPYRGSDRLMFDEF